MKPSREILEFQFEYMTKLVESMLNHQKNLILAIAPFAPQLAKKELDIISDIEKAKAKILNPPE